MNKQRSLFSILKTKYPLESINELYAMILCGEVLVNGIRSRDPKQCFDKKCTIEIKKRKNYVSRGGLKLEKALNVFDISCENKICLDCGASTGGFTDCLIKRNAKMVYAVDVGSGQFDYHLRQDPRIILLEKTNIMSLTLECFREAPHIGVIDLSFRSLRKAAKHIIELVTERKVIALVKPQFELINPKSNFNGIVDDPRQRKQILCQLKYDLDKENVFLENATVSPIDGAKGNIEYLFLLSNMKKLDDESCENLIEELF